MIVYSALTGIFAGLFIVQWWRRRRERDRLAEEREAHDKLALAWRRELWATISGWGTLLGDLRAGQLAELERSGQFTGVEPAISATTEQGDDEYARAIESAVGRFPDPTVDQVMALGLTWMTVGFGWRSCILSIEQVPGELPESTAALRDTLARHQEALDALARLMTVQYPEITEPVEVSAEKP
ncbi:MAG TPA: hypothetical protein VG502_00040 [Flexivirga sp.]|uniref:hypothetical protein n=1 Tax=Flexivirga sp. TaxID=1962927 RepID=UPI002BDF10BC|nr:hypothetical protein [Flexivirga sp.]HWC20661.1 hypothetical protein [Flexivirga sp.]